MLLLGGLELTQAVQSRLTPVSWMLASGQSGAVAARSLFGEGSLKSCSDAMLYCPMPLIPHRASRHVCSIELCPALRVPEQQSHKIWQCWFC